MENATVTVTVPEQSRSLILPCRSCAGECTARGSTYAICPACNGHGFSECEEEGCRRAAVVTDAFGSDACVKHAGNLSGAWVPIAAKRAVYAARGRAAANAKRRVA